MIPFYFLLVIIFITFFILRSNKQKKARYIEPVIRQGDDLVIYSGKNEDSRFNTKTKEAKHWYALTIINNIKNYLINDQKNNKKPNILILGVSLGSIIIHLSNQYKHINITAIDLYDDYFHVVKKYAPSNIVKLLKADAKKFLKQNKNKYDYIICDIFGIDYVPDFVVTTDFMNGINNRLKKGGKFFINTKHVEHKRINRVLKKSFPNYSIKNIPRFNYPTKKNSTITIVY
jgi:2-polyprenyl-3-methyl-5-hydroxy-6-metoxy-1,4-benzoquinol methylase